MGDSGDAFETPCKIVWAKYGKFWYPATVVTWQELPDNLKMRGFRSIGKLSVIVQWFDEVNFSKVKIQNLDVLSDNEVDLERAGIPSGLLSH